MKRRRSCRAARLDELQAMLIREMCIEPASLSLMRWFRAGSRVSPRHIKRIIRGYRKQILRNRKLFKKRAANFIRQRAAALEKRIERQIFQDSYVPKFLGLFSRESFIDHHENHKAPKDQQRKIGDE